FLAMFTPAMPTKVSHVVATAFMTAAFLLASIAAFKLVRGSNHAYHKKALFMTMRIGLIFSRATALIGEFSGKYLAASPPEKLAAAEWHFDTSEQAPLLMYGILDGEEVKYALEIPFALSILAHGDPSAEVIGLDQFPEDETTPMAVDYLLYIIIKLGHIVIV